MSQRSFFVNPLCVKQDKTLGLTWPAWDCWAASKFQPVPDCGFRFAIFSIVVM